MNPIGIMQGRLSPPTPERLQTFPWASWEDEFNRARACGLDVIEWLFEADGYEHNPLWSDSGIDRIRRRIDQTGVGVQSVCADYFLAHPFVRVTEQARAQSIEVLIHLIIQAPKIGGRVIVLPVLEAAELRTAGEQAQLLDSLARPAALAAERRVTLGLETELSAAAYAELVERAGHPAIRAYYDTGNATARGYDAARDIAILGGRLCGVHVKDRPVGGPSVWLGEGDTDFAAVFTALAAAGYRGPLILQTVTGEDYLDAGRWQVEFVRRHLVRSAGAGAGGEWA